ncbi:MAG: DUF465 domain-containing protein [Pseudomonadota bacterium]|nr:MAG: hypothetical protein DIU74_12025 [Pseudomonadota bacterium]
MNVDELLERLAQLKREHRELDEYIRVEGARPGCDQLQLQRLKRKKLLLKDQIAWIERQLDPDVPA